MDGAYLPEDVVLRDLVVGFFAWVATVVVALGSLFFLKLFFEEDTAAFMSLVPVGLMLLFGIGRLFSTIYSCNGKITVD